MRIAAHHAYKDKDFVPSCAWSEHCYVQWGKSGLVISRDGNHYQTAFFEAFPDDNAGGFIRGEGATIADAEVACFEKYQLQVGCDHLWGRHGYENGGAICRRCKGFKTVFKPIVRLGDWRQPITRGEAILLDTRCEDRQPDQYERSIMMRERLFGRA